MDFLEAKHELTKHIDEFHIEKHPELIIEYMKAKSIEKISNNLIPMMNHLTTFLNSDVDLKKRLIEIKEAIKSHSDS